MVAQKAAAPSKSGVGPFYSDVLAGESNTSSWFCSFSAHDINGFRREVFAAGDIHGLIR